MLIKKGIMGDISHPNCSWLDMIPVQMWSRPCPILFATSTCWSRDPSSWRLWLWTMWRRTRRRRSGWFLQFWHLSGLRHESVTAVFVSNQDETETSAERKSEQKSAPLENGLSPASGPAGHTPVATTPKVAAASQQAASTGSIQQGLNHDCVKDF